MARVTDVDGNVYQTIDIGSQTWMAENLRTTKYRNGTPIPYATDDNRRAENYCWYNHDEAGTAETYGALYSAFAVCTGNLCPTGWSIASLSDWMELDSYLTDNGYGYGGSGDDVAKALASTSGWDGSTTPGTVGNNQGSNNSSGLMPGRPVI